MGEKCEGKQQEIEIQSLEYLESRKKKKYKGYKKGGHKRCRKQRK